MKHNAASSKFVQPTTILAALMVTVASQAGPAPGYADLVPPGAWSERWTAVYRVFEMGDGATYKVDAFSPCLEYVDGTGHWEWIREYGNATIWLNNIPGTSWYSPSDTNLDFVVSIPALTLKLRNPAGASTNPYAAYLEMEVSAHAGDTLLLATYAGYPAVTNEPETPDVVAYTMATGGFASARLALTRSPAQRDWVFGLLPPPVLRSSCFGTRPRTACTKSSAAPICQRVSGQIPGLLWLAPGQHYRPAKRSCPAKPRLSIGFWNIQAC